MDLMYRHGMTPTQRLIWLKKALGGEVVPSVEKTVSGSIIHVMDALAKPVKNLTVSIEPVQQGSGDPAPENIRPITGWTGCNVYRSGADTSDPTTYSVSFGEAGTVYSGTLDVTTGVLSVDQFYVEVSSNSDISRIAAGSGGAAYFRIMAPNQVLYGNSAFCKCSHLKTSISIASNNTNIGIIPYRTGSSPNYTYGFSFRFSNDVVAYGNIEAMKTYADAQIANGTPIQMLCKFAEPITYQLTPTQIRMLLGENNIWADTGDSELTYLAEA